MLSNDRWWGTDSSWACDQTLYANSILAFVDFWYDNVPRVKKDIYLLLRKQNSNLDLIQIDSKSYSNVIMYVGHKQIMIPLVSHSMP